MPEDREEGERPPNDQSGATAWAQIDVHSGLSEYFTPQPGFGALEGFGPDPISNGSFTTVVWEYAGRHDSVFQGVQPTGRPVLIRGVTVIDHTADEPRFHRYVDWLDVMGQLGLTAAMRPVVDELPARAVEAR